MQSDEIKAVKLNIGRDADIRIITKPQKYILLL